MALMSDRLSYAVEDNFKYAIAGNVCDFLKHCIYTSDTRVPAATYIAIYRYLKLFIVFT